MKKAGWIRAVAAACVAALVLVACGTNDAPDEVAVPEPDDDITSDETPDEPVVDEDLPDEFILGGSFTLSGPAAFLGVLEKAGIELAIEQLNRGECIVELDPPQPCEGGGLQIGDQTVPVRFIAYDDVTDSRRAIDNVTRLVEQDGALAVWGPRMNEAVVAAASILEPAGVINVCSICSSPAMTIGRDYGFDITDTGVLEKHTMAHFILEEDDVLEEHGIDPSIFEGRTKTAIIGRDELYVVHGARGWRDFINGADHVPDFTRRQQYEEFDIDRDLVLYPFGTTDFAPFVRRLAELEPDIVLMDVYIVPDMVAIMAEMVRQGLDFQNGDVILLGNDVFMLDFFIEAAEAEGMDMSNQWVWGWQEQNPGIEDPGAAGLFDEETLDRIDLYTERYNEFHADDEDALALGGFARGTYDAAMWLFMAIQAADTFDTDVIAETWKNSRLDGLRGPGMELFQRPDTGEMTGQLFVTNYIMGVRDSLPYYTGLAYREEVFIGPWVYGDALPE